MKLIILSVALMTSIYARTQDSTSNTTTEKAFNLSGYLEGYYSFDLNKPASNIRPTFIYNFNRHNEFNVNLGFIKGSYSTHRVRTNVAIAVGTYMNANYAAEPLTLKNIYEANAGYRLSRSKNLWLDIGILPSHIGFESAIGKDNWTLTRSLVADNSPYFQSGAKLSYINGSGTLQLAALALNGWQRISRLDGSSMVSFGTQIHVKPSEKIILNYSTFFGTDKPDSLRLFRSYHNVYGIFQFSSIFGFTAGFDIGFEEKVRGANGSNKWFAPVGILRIKPNDVWSIAIRGEYFNDRHGVIIPSGSINGFKTAGASVNVDYGPSREIVLRLEGRYIKSKDPIFTKNNSSTNNTIAVTFSTAVAF